MLNQNRIRRRILKNKHKSKRRNELGKGRATAILADGIKKNINKLAFSKKSRIFVAKNIKKEKCLKI